MAIEDVLKHHRNGGSTNPNVEGRRYFKDDPKKDAEIKNKLEAQRKADLASTKKEKKKDRRKKSRTKWYDEKDPKERTRRWKEDTKSRKWFTPEWKERLKREWKADWGRRKRSYRELPGDIKREWKKAKGWGPKIGKVGLVGGAGAWLGHTIGATLMDQAIKKLTEKEKRIPIKEAVKKEIQRRKRRTAEREEIKKAKK